MPTLARPVRGVGKRWASVESGRRLCSGKMRNKITQGTLALVFAPVFWGSERREWTAKVLGEQAALAERLRVLGAA
jgi:hypothetical protein